MSSRRFVSKELLYTIAPLAIAAGFAYAAHGGLLCNGGHQTQVTVVAKATKGTRVDVYQDGEKVKAKAKPQKRRNRAKHKHLGSKVFRATETHWVPRTLVEKLVADPSLLREFGDVVPDRNCRGGLNGFRVENTVKRGLFRRLGFRDGDLITAIDEQRLESRRDARDAISALQQADRVTLTVIRHNKTLQKTFLIE